MVTFLEGVAKHLVKPTALDPFQEGCALTDVNHTKSQRTLTGNGFSMIFTGNQL